MDRAREVKMISAQTLDTTGMAVDLHAQGLALRQWQGDKDYDVMSRVLIASRNADGLEEARTGDELKTMYDLTKNFDAAQNLFLAEQGEMTVAYAGCRWWEENDGGFTHAHWLFCLPEWRGRGIEDELLKRTQARLRECAVLHPPGATNWYETFAFDSQAWLAERILADGYAPVRYFHDMVCHALDAIPDAELPPGIETRPVQPEHWRQIWDAGGEAFREHWGEAVEDESDYERWLQNPKWNPELWQVAWDGDQVVGSVLSFVDESENAKYNYRRGYTENISVRKPWRGRGVAKALLVRAMRMFRDLGFDHTALGVDSENETGAHHLYKNVGYRVVRTETIYRKAMRLADAPEISG
jgi:ribosomal protein S18 acetylase RimI-like enzyme